MIERIKDHDDGGRWRIDDVEFITAYGLPSTPNRFFIQKAQSIVSLYERLCPRFVGGRLVELGIASGGSTAMLALLTSPERLVACEIDDQPPEALTAFIEQRGLGESVRPYFGVDQSDRERLQEILDKEFGREPLDLVIDDASHRFEPTRASFEVLFPRLRGGGCYVIEDWAAQYLWAEGILAAAKDRSSARYAELRASREKSVREGATPNPPVARLGLELMLAAAASPEVVTSVEVNEHWIAVERGAGELDEDEFTIASLYDDHFGWLTEQAGGGGRGWLARTWERAQAE